MKTKLAVGITAIALGLFSSAASAQSTTYFNISQAFGKATSGVVSQPGPVAGQFESSWMYLHESHGVGVAPQVGTIVAGEHCNTQRVAVYESSWLNLIESQRNQVPDSGGTFVASVDGSKC